MDAGLLRSFGKIGGLAGLALGVFLYLFSDTLQSLSREELGLDSRSSYLLFVTLMVLTFGIAALSLLVWLMARNAGRPERPSDHGLAIVAIVLMFFAVLGVIVAMPIIVSNDTEQAQITPLPESATKPKPEPEPIKTIQTSVNVCVGQHGSVCGNDWVHLGCGANVEEWARQMCLSYAVTRISDTGGNRCGYYRVKVDCLKAVN